MKIDEKRLRKLFPHLAGELESEKNRIAISSVRSSIKVGERASSKRFVRYVPDVIDYLRRCDNEHQAEEIINYLKKRGEISREYARRLKNQLKEKGVRSFGSKKEEDHYLKLGGV